MIAGQNSGNLNTIRMDFTCRRYDTFSETFNITYYDSDGILQEVDLTNASAQMWIKKKKTDTTPILVMDVNLSGNELTISKDRNSMKLARGNYFHDIEIKNSDGDHITWIEGKFKVLEHITEYIDEYITEYYNYFINLLSFLDVPKKILKETFESILSFLPDLSWVLYPVIQKFEMIISFMDQLTKRLKVIFSNTIVVNNCKKIIHSTTWSAIFSDSTTIEPTLNQSYLSNILRIYGQYSPEGLWVLQYDSGSSEIGLEELGTS